MRIRNIYFSLLLMMTFVPVALFSQSWTKPYDVEVKYTLTKLEVRQKFLNELEACIFNDSCPAFENKKNKYFSMLFERDAHSHFTVRLELLKLPLGNEKGYGYFELNNYIFIVSQNVPEGIFKKDKCKKNFEFKMGRLANPESFPNWNFIYKDQQLELIDFYCW